MFIEHKLSKWVMGYQVDQVEGLCWTMLIKVIGCRKRVIKLVGTDFRKLEVEGIRLGSYEYK